MMQKLTTAVTVFAVVVMCQTAFGEFVNYTETFDGTLRDINTWKLWENHPNQVFTQDEQANLDAYDFDPRFSSRCSYVTLEVTVGVGESVRAEVTYNEPMDSYGLGGIMLTSDNETLDAISMESYVWLINTSSGWGNNIAAGFKPLGGTYNWDTEVVATPQPVGDTYVYQIERLSSDTIRCTVFEADGTTQLGQASVTINNIVDELYICLYTLQCDMSYDNVTVDVVPPLQCGDVNTVYLTSDLNNDCIVEWADFGIFAGQWQQCTDPADANCNEYWTLPSPW